MHILYIHQHFASPHGKTGTRSYEFARRWVAAGHRVTVLTGIGQLTDRDLGGGPTGAITRYHVDGIDVVAFNVPYHQGMGWIRRVVSFVGFMLLACWLVLRTKYVDVVYASSTPLSVGVPALVGWCVRRLPYVFEVRDVWPAVPVALGIIRNKVLIRLLERLERAIYRRARAIVALSPGMAASVKQRAPEGTPIATIPNSADTELFRPDVDGRTAREERGWHGRFVCLHCGAMGRVNGLDAIVRAAKHFERDPDFLFVLLGDGKEKSRLLAERDRLGLKNLQIVDALRKSELPAVVAAADVGLMTVANVAILQDNSANKFFDYLSAGKPVVLNYGGWQREVLESTGAGLGCDQGDDRAFFANLAAVKAEPERCAAMGLQARKLALERFDRDALASQALQVLLGAHGAKETPEEAAASNPRTEDYAHRSLSERPRTVRAVRPLVYVGIAFVFLALTLYACAGPRGSDQFWYLGDTITLLEGGPPLTNTIYPGPLLRGDFRLEENFFSHHTLVSYLVLPFAMWLGAYQGWIAFNIVCAFATAALVAVCLNRLATRSVALLGYSVFLLLPVTTWQTGNALQEVAFCMLAMSLTALYIFAERGYLRWIVIFVVSAVAVLCHPLYLPPAVAFPILFLWRHRGSLTMGHFAVAALTLGVVVWFQIAKSAWFPSIYQPSVTAVLLSAIPGNGNMEWHFRADLPALTPGLMISKALAALKCQVAWASQSIFFWPANLMIVGSALLVRDWRNSPRIARLASVAVAFVALFALLVCLHQNQFRYSLIITPVILTATAVYLHRSLTAPRRRRVAAWLAALALLVFVSIDVALARHLHRDGRQAALTIEHIRRQTKDLANDAKIWIEADSSGEPLMLAYALRPRRCLILKRGYLSPREIDRLLESFSPSILFCRPDSSLPSQAGAMPLEADWPGRYHVYKAYEVHQTGG